MLEKVIISWLHSARVNDLTIYQGWQMAYLLIYQPQEYFLASKLQNELELN